MASPDFFVNHNARLLLAKAALEVERRQGHRSEGMNEHGLPLVFEPYGKSFGGAEGSLTFAELEAWARLKQERGR